jgi:sugar O-acyltransferase (sialic acid O-acetyltransferase NeuD family)
MKPLFIIGTAGHARDIAEVAAALEYRPILVAATRQERDAADGSDEIALESEVCGRTDGHFAIGVGDNRRRAAIAAEYREVLTFPSLVHPDTTLGRGMSEMLLSRSGTILFPGVRVMGRCHIGHFCTLNLNATVSHDCHIDDFATLAPGAHIAGNVRVEQGAWIGMGVVVNQGNAAASRRIGAWAMVGSGAAVLRDVPDGATHVGVPAREILR